MKLGHFLVFRLSWDVRIERGIKWEFNIDLVLQEKDNFRDEVGQRIY